MHPTAAFLSTQKVSKNHLSKKKPHLICLNIFAPLTDLLFYYTVNNLVLGDAKLL